MRVPHSIADSVSAVHIEQLRLWTLICSSGQQLAGAGGHQPHQGLYSACWPCLWLAGAWPVPRLWGVASALHSCRGQLVDCLTLARSAHTHTRTHARTHAPTSAQAQQQEGGGHVQACMQGAGCRHHLRGDGSSNQSAAGPSVRVGTAEAPSLRRHVWRAGAPCACQPYVSLQLPLGVLVLSIAVHHNCK